VAGSPWAILNCLSQTERNTLAMSPCASVRCHATEHSGNVQSKPNPERTSFIISGCCSGLKAQSAIPPLFGSFVPTLSGIGSPR